MPPLLAIPGIGIYTYTNGKADAAMNQQKLPHFLCGQRVTRCVYDRNGRLTVYFGPLLTIETCQGAYHNVSQWVLTLTPPITFTPPIEQLLKAIQGCRLEQIVKDDSMLSWQFSQGIGCIQCGQPEAPLPFSLAHHDPNGTNVVSLAND